MVSLVVAVVLGMQPVADSPRSSGLLSEPTTRSARLFDGALAQAVPPPATGGSVRDRALAEVRLMSAAEIQAEIESLQASMPSTTAGTVMTVIGGIGLIGGLSLSYIGLIFALIGGGGVMALVGLGVAAVGVVLLVVGIINLVQTSKERRAISADIAALKRQLAGDQQGPPPMPPPDVLPPQVRGPEAGLLLASF